MSGLLLRDAEVDGHARVDVRVAGGRIAEIGTGLARRPGERAVDCAGGALLPGLCDHHLHLHAMAAAARSVRCGPPHVTTRGALAAALRGAAADAHGWIRGTGYAESVAGHLDAAGLDALRADRPVRIQHRSGAMWTLNSAAVRAAGLAAGRHPGIERDADGAPTGRLWRADGWLRDRLPPAPPADLAATGRRLLAAGVTAVTDATPDLDGTALAAIGAAVRGGALPQRVHLLGVPLDGPPAPPGPRITTGPYKIVLADSGLPSLDGLADRIAAAHAADRAVAVHCVTREALFLLLAALDAAGTRPGDRIEHAALVPPETAGELAARGLRVVTQPGFLADRGDDYLRDVPAADRPDLYRCAGLAAAGVPVGLSSDAPYGPADPWAVMDAAVRRRTRTGAVLGPGEALTPGAALRSYLSPPGDPGGAPRRVRAGAPGDLVLLHAPLRDALARLSSGDVREVWPA
ncbi:amidohydrolase family protein [Actinomadura sp. WMMB 499]|uniref:amidohydrolase family protein n=1 Tax=Actinomadura sp. WMMB 499 TaxID=1219491 RepID=UPI001243C924|nr:amidohydrolase family protein [Actinomadura sp. WMMB 499]QFG26129.1 amidohydrolase family protein [Actinomadura sp. WMMB 499]